MNETDKANLQQMAPKSGPKTEINTTAICTFAVNLTTSSQAEVSTY